MKEIISKELLSLVLGEEIIEIDGVNENLIGFYFASTANMQLHNLDTLGRLCKEWVYKEFKITIQSAVSGTGGFAFSPTYLSYPGLDTETVFTEVEAIIDVTEHIAKEKGLL